MKKRIIKISMLGLALFSVFFGAGNMLFPPYLGTKIGSFALPAIIGFVLTGVGLPAASLLLNVKLNGDYIKYYSIAGKKFAILVSIITFIVIGPIVAIPRTATTTFEVSFKPFFNVPQWVIVLIYFVVVYIFVYNKSKVIEILSKFLTPILVISLFLFILFGIFTPAPTYTKEVANTFTTSLSEGYLTMDALASGLVLSLVWDSLKEEFSDIHELKKYTYFAVAMAVSALTIVYAGLIYLGSKFAGIDVIALETSRSAILEKLSILVVGKTGNILMSIIMAATCLTTAVGLTSVGADLIAKVTKGKLSYKLSALVISIISFAFGVLSLNNIIAISIPILFIMYPVTILMTVYGFLKERLNSFAVSFSIYSIFVYTLILEIFKYMGYKGILSSSISWIPFAIITYILGVVYDKRINGNIRRGK